MTIIPPLRKEQGRPREQIKKKAVRKRPNRSTIRFMKP